MWNHEVNKWGRDNRLVETAFEHIEPGLSYDGLGAIISTFESFPASATYDGMFQANLYPEPAVISAPMHKLQSLSGLPGVSSMDLWDIGDDVIDVTLKRVRPRFTTKPDTGTLSNFKRQSLGDTLTPGPVVSMVASRFDVLTSSRWHRNRLRFTGQTSIHGVDNEIRVGGKW